MLVWKAWKLGNLEVWRPGGLEARKTRALEARGVTRRPKIPSWEPIENRIAGLEGMEARKPKGLEARRPGS